MKLVLVLVVMCLVGAALSKSVRHKRALGQTKKRGDLERLLKLLLESNDKKSTAAKRGKAKTTKRGPGGNGPPCESPSIPAALATLATNFYDNAVVFTLQDLVDAVTPPVTKKRMLLHKRQGGGGGKAVRDCVKELLEYLPYAIFGDADPEEECPTFPTTLPDLSGFTDLFTDARPGPTPEVVATTIRNMVAAIMNENSGMTEKCVIYFALGGDPCIDPSVNPALFAAMSTWSLENLPDIDALITLVGSGKRRLLHWKRGRRSVAKRRPEISTAMLNIFCIDSRLAQLENLVEDTGTCDGFDDEASDNTPLDGVITGLQSKPPTWPTLVEFLTALKSYVDTNSGQTPICLLMNAGEVIEEAVFDPCRNPQIPAPLRDALNAFDPESPLFGVLITQLEATKRRRGMLHQRRSKHSLSKKGGGPGNAEDAIWECLSDRLYDPALEIAENCDDAEYLPPNTDDALELLPDDIEAVTALDEIMFFDQLLEDNPGVEPACFWVGSFNLMLSLIGADEWDDLLDFFEEEFDFDK